MIFPLLLIQIMISNIFKVLLFISFFIFDIMFLGIAPHWAAAALGGAVGGAMVLGYIKPQKNWIERIIKVICSATSAVFIAPAIIRYYNIESTEYIGLLFFIVSMLSLFVLRALINLTEQNAGTAIKQAFARLFNIQVKETKEKHLPKGEN